MRADECIDCRSDAARLRDHADPLGGDEDGAAIVLGFDGGAEGRRDAAQPVLDWLAQSGHEDPQLASLAQKLAGGKP